MTIQLPLEGIRIVEMGQLIAIPYAVKLLSDMGAEIIRIESCTRLETYRGTAFYDDNVDGEWWNRGINFYEQNRNKRSLALDLTTSRGQEILLDLIKISDVFAENFTPRVIKNFGLEYDTLRKVRPDIIMVSSTGYGYNGPWSNFGAIGYGTEATSGLAHITGYKDGPPAIPEIPYADYTAAEHTVFAIVAALLHRARTGHGQFIDVSQSETLSATIPEALMDYTVNDRIAGRIGNRSDRYFHQGCYPCSGYENFIAISVITDKHWQSLCDILQMPIDLEGHKRPFLDPITNDHNFRDSMIADKTRQWDKRELELKCQAKGIPAGAVLDGKELLFDSHLRSRGFFEVAEHVDSTSIPPLPYVSRPWVFSKTPGQIFSSAPLLGQHNHWALSEILGKSEKDISDVIDSGTVGTTPKNVKPVTQPSPQTLLNLGRIVHHDPGFKNHVHQTFVADQP